MNNTLPKSEIISGKNDIGDLMNKGRWGVLNNFKFCYLCRDDDGANRIMVSVPKRNFKRAVKRNLLKRRIRESYRTRKDLLNEGKGIDILFFYNSKEVLESSVIVENISEILRFVSDKAKA